MVKKPSKAQKAKLRKGGGGASTESIKARGGKGGRGRGRGGAATTGGGRLGRSALLPPDQQAAFESRRRIVQLEESAFSKLSPPVLERLNILASYADLRRPIPDELTHFDYSRFGRARAENHQRTVDQEPCKKDEQELHPLAGWLNTSWTGTAKDAISSDESDGEDQGEEDPGVTGIEGTGELRLPKRPKWRSDMDTKTIHAQETQVFRQWLRKTDAVVERAFFASSPLFAGLNSHTRSQDKAAFPSSSATPTPGMGGSRMVSNITSQDAIAQLLTHRPLPGTSVIGSLYERNIEVHRQLWRVCERSDLVCVLADARCPLLHLPPSLIGFLERYMRLKVVIVLTKADIVPKNIVEQWKKYLKELYPRWEVVATESYAKMERIEGQGSRTRFAPYLSPHSRKELFAALRKAHKDLITPPKVIREDKEGKGREWIPPCATDTDWEGVERRVQMHTEGLDSDTEEQATDAPVQALDEDAPNTTEPSKKEGGEGKETRAHLPYLTIGLMGQPNVGKSSLLNALFGSKVVRASKTPGKTKHFQTYFLVPLPSPNSSSSPSNLNTPKEKAVGEETHRGQIRLCDSPGLVFPSLIGMEMQVMGAILAISQVQAITSCIRFVAEHIPLEKVLQLEHPPDDDNEGGTGEEEGEKVWTGVKILEAVARRYGYRTAKANRWDVNRAGNLVMRAVAEGRIKWAFRPPSSDRRSGEGIWFPDFDRDAARGADGAGEDLLTAPNTDDDDQGEDVDEKKDEGEEESEDQDDPEAIARKVRFDFGSIEEDDDEEDDDAGGFGGSTNSLFSALAVEDGGDDDEEDSDEEDDEDEEEEEEEEEDE
ncbi:hypothetical protein NDA11_007483 [Ustilago hordei]|uniref:Guanine nucleotide-binding protein-like 1 n=1 Tax=Ustilago hordei TaxID=120017 RepID=I2FMN3_USTHO|nr:uncharacterized protein UHO2_00479 [Ustilago hordei]KAJ1041536.1 hypothetical protein NDA10_001215 [Ustilago hordei]KAJ1571068.1 hypothetical protein NDA11_007483 [Ustilago hordei]KAJ1587442.1 hypothetical protein NDA15_005655 [Ustilago hordei]KAJ1590281.1 hypothetical protein NDA12_005808 [Ustilago hordei]KAJ1602249.1 hypothetical protein NDA14_003381 [Ustilago hordei]